ADLLPPPLSADIRQFYLATDPRGSQSERLVYRPAIIGMGRLHFVDRKSDIDDWRKFVRVCPIDEQAPRSLWDECEHWDDEQIEFEDPQPGAQYSPLPSDLSIAKNYTAWKSRLKDSLYRSGRLELTFCPSLNLYSNPGETTGD